MSRLAASGCERFHVAAPFASLFSLQSAHARIYIHFCGAIHFTPVQLKALWCSHTQDEQLIEQHETSSYLSLNKLHARAKFVVAAGVIKSCPFKIKSGSRFVNARRESPFSSPEARLPSALWNFGFTQPLPICMHKMENFSSRKQQQQHFYVTNDGKLCARHAPTPLAHTMVQVGLPNVVT